MRRVCGLAAALGLLLAGCAAPEAPFVDPLSVAPPDSPNWALAAPAGVETVGRATHRTPSYAATPQAALAAFDAAIRAEPRVERVERSGETPVDATYVQRSLMFRFPDVVSVRALDLGDGRASLAVYSASVYGYGDLGVNDARMTRLLEAVSARMGSTK